MSTESSIPETGETPVARIIKASHVLKAKVGSGSIDPLAVRRGQAVIDTNTYDFVPLARQYLFELENSASRLRQGEISPQQTVDFMGRSVMQLKASAPLFRYKLLGELTQIMLGFLEGIKEADEDALAIIDAHLHTLKTILAKKLEGDGGIYGERLKAELIDACKRYFAKLNTNASKT